MYAITQVPQSSGKKTVFIELHEKYKELIQFIPYTLIGITDNIEWKKPKLNSTLTSIEKIIVPHLFFSRQDNHSSVCWSIPFPQRRWNASGKYETVFEPVNCYASRQATKLTDETYGLACDLFGWIDNHEIPKEKRKRVDWRGAAKAINLEYWNVFKSEEFLPLINISEIII